MDKGIKKKLRQILVGMRQRCVNKNNKSYKYYGAKGITVCAEWQGTQGVQNFINWAEMNGYQEGLTIDRIDHHEGYSPQNCRWVTMREQNRNNRNGIVFITFNGETKLISDWAICLGIPKSTLVKRIRTLNWPIEEAFGIKPREERRGKWGRWK